jgi:fatty acid desaturase
LLADLRKAVTEETTKATDATRQIVAAIASALAIAQGMIVARISVALSLWLILLVMVVALGDVTVIAMSGWHFIGVQRSLRTQWQLKPYRFLSAKDYEETCRCFRACI